MIKNKFAGNLYSIMERLAEAQIQMNCQIVLCPGYNDKEELERTVSDLTKLYPYLYCMSIYFYRFSINIYYFIINFLICYIFINSFQIYQFT